MNHLIRIAEIILVIGSLLWAMSRPMSAGYNQDGPFTGWEKSKIISLLENIEQNTRK